MPQCDMDRISDLPDPILAQILSLVPTEEVVQTCILSKRWINVWALVPVLVFDHKVSHGVTEEEFLEHEYRFLALVKGVLDHRQNLPLDTFKLKWRGKYSAKHPYALQIISRATMCRPRVFSIDFTDISINWPGSILTCASVEEMSLDQSYDTDEMFIQAESINLPRLKKLDLANVNISDDFMSTLLSGCPVLEDLGFTSCTFDIYEISSPVLKKITLECCSQFDEMQISCPGVVSLLIDNCDTQGLTLKNMVSVVTANISSIDVMDSDSEEIHLELLSGLPNVVNLRLYTRCPYVVDLWSANIPNCPTFNNLKSLELGELDMNLNWNFVVCLLQHSPNLKSLALHFRHPKECCSHPKFLGDVSFLLEYLETVEIGFDNRNALFSQQVVRGLCMLVKSIGKIIIL